MFQRIKGAIDSRIAEEQARQRSAAQIASPSRSGPTTIRASSSRNLSPSQIPRHRERADVNPEKSPDPSEFDSDRTGGEDKIEDGASKDEIPEHSTKEHISMLAARAAGMPGTTMTTEVDGAKTPAQRNDELPAEVLVKLRKLERLEDRYQELLKAYRSAHARVQTIEPFEASLRENTPLTSISDPGALLEYLTQINLKSDMVLDELKRVSAERDGYRNRLDEGEKEEQALKDEPSKRTPQEQNPPSATEQLVSPRESQDLSSARHSGSAQPIESSTSVKSPTTSTSSRIPSFSLFSAKNKLINSPQEEKDTSEEFFSFDNELPRLEAELQEKRTHIDDLEKQVSSLQGDLSVARESTEGMVQSLEAATQELHVLREANEKEELTSSELKIKINGLEQEISSFTSYRAAASQDISGLESKISDMNTILEQKDGVLSLMNRAEEERKVQSDASERVAAELREEIRERDARITNLEESLVMAQSAEREHVQNSRSASASQKQIGILNSIMDTLRSQLKAAEGEIMELKEIKRKAEDKIGDLPELKAHNDRQEETRLKLADEAVDRYVAHAVDLPSTKYFGFVNDAEFSLSGDAPTAFQQFSKIVKKTRPELYKALIAVENEKDQAAASSEAATEANDAIKKSKKRKKKNKSSKESTADQPTHEPPAKVTETLDDEEEETHPHAVVLTIRNLEERIKDLENQLEGKAATVKSLSTKLRDQDALNEEIETLRDDLLHQGEEHVEARDALKAARLERSVAEESVSNVERELTELRAHYTTRSAEFEKMHGELLSEVEDLKTSCGVLRTDLAAAEQLAASRFKDVADLRELLSKVQPELRNLRVEVEELRPAKESLDSKVGELTRFEARHEDLKSDMKNLRRRVGEKDIEIRDVRQKLVDGHSMKIKVEEELESVRSELYNAELAGRAAAESQKQSSGEILKARQDLHISKTKIREMEEAIRKQLDETRDLREELSAKTSLHGSTQAALTSLREQALELSTQAREACTKVNSLEEELAETQRMLSERSREGETMRRLLADTEDRTASKIRDLKERMETAVEERDTLEDEASTSTRRTAREVEDLRNKIREANRSLKAAEDEKEELARSEKDLKRRRGQLEATQDNARAEAAEAQAAVKQFREALNQREREGSEFERQKAETKRMLEDLQERVEVLQKANKDLTDELKSFQQQHKAGFRPSGVLRSEIPSLRSSLESSGTLTPSTRDRLPSNNSSTTAGPASSEIDYVYLKNVLLQFLEQRDKSLQKQLIPVLGMLLNFDRKEEQKWMAAVTAR